MPSDDSRLIPGKGEVKVRLYGQGLGDCFLLAFPPAVATSGRASYMVIDCGAAKSTPGRRERAEAVVEDIAAATGGRIDVLAITHQHFDHISGFQDAWEAWSRLEIGALYLPWTEAGAESGTFSSTKKRRDALERAARKILETLHRDGVLDTMPELRAEADFLGVAEDGVHWVDDPPSNMNETMEFIRSLCPEEIHYFEPGDVFRLPGTDCHGYVLGPPLADTKEPGGRCYIDLLTDEDDEVMYNYGQLGMEVDHGKPGGSTAMALSDDCSLPALASSLMLDGAVDRGSDEVWSPFDPRVRFDWDGAMASDFFKESYGEEPKGLNGGWRRIDHDWLCAASQLALRAGNFTNNLSMVLAFDVPGSEKMLLFPGDAQVGNWLSWHTIDRWRPRDDARPANPPAANGDQTLMENLLSRVAFYKVGHHGSHNATIRTKGLEAMTRDDLVAYVPVSVPIAQDKMGYCPMPFYPVMRALHRRTGGRVFLPTGKAVRFGESAKLGVEAAAEHHREMLKQANIVPSRITHPEPRNDPDPGEPDIPLYLELTVH